MTAASIAPFARPSTPRGIALFLLDSGVYATLFVATLVVGNPVARLALGIVTGLAAGRLFLLAHDACHHSLTASRRLNEILGRLAFLPTLFPFSLWDLGHNRIHHRRTNDLDVDYVWRPLSPREYRRLSAFGRAYYRFTRTPWGLVCEFAINIWLRRMMLFEIDVPRPERRRVYHLDRALVSIFLVSQVLAAVGLIAWLRAPEDGLLATSIPAVFAAIVVPLLVWNALAAFLTYLHHTDPEIAWYRHCEWQPQTAQVDSTVRIVLPAGLGRALHNIMDHTAHHVHQRIPCYHLREAQALLERYLGDRAKVRPLSPRRFLATLRTCKLYDPDRHAWCDTSGELTRPLQTPGPTRERASRAECHSPLGADQSC